MTLKPCPFCGDLDILIERKEGYDDIRVFCLNCGCSTKWHSWPVKGGTEISIERAIESWNRRANE